MCNSFDKTGNKIVRRQSSVVDCQSDDEMEVNRMMSSFKKGDSSNKKYSMTTIKKKVGRSPRTQQYIKVNVLVNGVFKQTQVRPVFTFESEDSLSIHRNSFAMHKIINSF